MVFKWTNKRPTKEGWYWVRVPGCVDHFIKLKKSLKVGGAICIPARVGSPHVTNFDFDDWEWSGPIPEPV